MALAWNEIKDCALAFSKEWAKAELEDVEANMTEYQRSRVRIVFQESRVNSGHGFNYAARLSGNFMSTTISE
jgi:hypothetical protein